MQKTIKNQTSIEDYEMCITDNSDLPRPPFFTYYLFGICAIVSFLGAIVFQCSYEVQQKSYRTMRRAMSSFAFSASRRRFGIPRSPFPSTTVECISNTGETAGAFTVTTDTVVIIDQSDSGFEGTEMIQMSDEDSIVFSYI